MACHGCTKKYGLFTKEIGCPSCGFSFCSKCLKNSIEIAKLGNAKKKVCLSCYEKSKTSSEPDNGAEEKLFIANIEKSVNVLETDETNVVDLEIANKLKSLKEDKNNTNPIPNDVDIATRLANLRGTEYKDYSKNTSIHKVDNRSDQEKIDDLMKQYAEEYDISEAASSNPLSDIENRLASLKGETSTKSEKTSAVKADYAVDSSSEDEDTIAKNIMKKYIAEAALDDGLTPEEKEYIKSIPSSQDTEELPWCAICNEDAVIRCNGCDGDLFCKSCFKECHDDEEYKEHQTKPYKKPINAE